MEILFYNKSGRPVAYTQDQATIYLYNGEAVAYLDGDAVYAFEGRHLGWFVEGRVLDHAGHDVFFTDLAMGRPATPIKLAPIPKGVKHARPIWREQEGRPMHPERKRAWAARSSEAFFLLERVACASDDIPGQQVSLQLLGVCTAQQKDCLDLVGQIAARNARSYSTTWLTQVA